jgi:peptide deformylase
MFELMYEAKGVGLAANQVDLPLRLFVSNPAGKVDDGTQYVFINPVISQPKGNAEEEEGCLSVPGVYARVRRPERVRIQAFDLAGDEIDLTLDGLLARIVQHETDHLDGILFFDRLSDGSQQAVRGALEEFEIEYRQLRRLGQIPPEEDIRQRLAEVEAHYCAL